MTRVRLIVDVNIFDEDRLRAYAEDRYRAEWGGIDESYPSTIQGQLMEALVLSNENPSPADYGIEIEDWAWEPRPERG